MDRDILSDAAAQRHLEEVFRWTDAKTGDRWLFLVGRIQAVIDAGHTVDGPITVEILEHQYQHVIERNGVEAERVARLDPSRRDKPVLFADMGDGTHVLIDGNHRVARRWQDGLRDVEAYLVPHSFWHPCYGWRL